MYEPGLGDAIGDAAIVLILLGGFVLIVVSMILFNFEVAKPLVAALYVAGCVAVWFGLYLTKDLTIIGRTPAGVAGFPDVITINPRLSPFIRYLLYFSLFFEPVIAGLVFVAGIQVARHRLRIKIPMVLRSALDHFHHGQYDAAIAEYTRALELAPAHAEAYDRRGRCYFQKGDFDHALSDFNQSLALDPKNGDAYLHRGLVHVSRGFHDLAVVDFNTSLDFQPNVLDAHLNRGICRFKLGDYHGALADFRLILHLTNHSDYTEPARHYLQQMGVAC